MSLLALCTHWGDNSRMHLRVTRSSFRFQVADANSQATCWGPGAATPNTDLGNAFRAAQVSWAPALCLPFESFGWGGQPYLRE